MARDRFKRVMYVKQLRYRTREEQDFEAPPLEQTIQQLFDVAPSIGERHYPEEPRPEERCCFLNQVVRSNVAGGMCFEVHGYEAGLDPTHMRPDMTADRVSVASGPILDEQTGDRRELVKPYRMLVLGQAAIVETVRGAGGLGMFERLLHHMLRKHVDPKHPFPRFVDVASRELEEMIHRGGGVQEVQLQLAHGQVSDDRKHAKMLSRQRSRIGNTQLLTVTHKGKGSTLDENDVIGAFEEWSDDDGLDKVAIKLNDGSTVPDLNHYRMRKEIEVSGAQGVVNAVEVMEEMRTYLAQLQDFVDGARILTEHGAFVSPGRR